jgi:hypothetical protein
MNMKREPDVREALGLKKEMEMFQRYAAREGAAKCEVDYYTNMAQRTASKINWKLLDPNRKKKRDEREGNEYR